MPKVARVGDLSLHSFLSSGLDGGEWSNFTPQPLDPQKKPLQYSFTRTLSGFQSRSSRFVEKSTLTRNCAPNRPAHSLVTIRITLFGTYTVVLEDRWLLPLSHLTRPQRLGTKTHLQRSTISCLCRHFASWWGWTRGLSHAETAFGMSHISMANTNTAVSVVLFYMHGLWQ
jgi:hypothetical protein